MSVEIPQIGFDHRKTERAEFELIELEELSVLAESSAHDPQRPHRVNFYGLLHITAGEGEHMVDFRKVGFGPSSVIFVQPEQVQAFDLSCRPQGRVLLFTQAFLDQVHANMRLPNFTPTHLNPRYQPSIRLDGIHQQRCERLFSELALETSLDRPDPLAVMYLFSTLSIVLHRLRPKETVGQLSDGQSRLMALFFEQLQQNFERVRDASWYAQQVNTTYKTLNLVCKRATQLTAKQLIDAFTLIEIKRRLVISQVSIQQIATELGFDDPSNFNKYFRNLTGTTARQFRQAFKTPRL